MTEDKVIRFATAVVVCAVAAFAAVVVAASLVLLHEARNNRDAPGLAECRVADVGSPRACP